VLIDAVTFLFKPMFDSLYRPVGLFLLGSEVALMSFAAVKMLLISVYELGTINMWQLVSRHNRFQESAMWFHFFTTASP
jgi:hypothetical protein